MERLQVLLDNSFANSWKHKIIIRPLKKYWNKMAWHAKQFGEKTQKYEEMANGRTLLDLLTRSYRYDLATQAWRAGTTLLTNETSSAHSHECACMKFIQAFEKNMHLRCKLLIRHFSFVLHFCKLSCTFYLDDRGLKIENRLCLYTLLDFISTETKSKDNLFRQDIA